MGRRQRRRVREGRADSRPARLARRQHERPTRAIDNSPTGQACRELRLAEPATPATVEELDRLGVGAELRAQARRWRRCHCDVCDYAVERLALLGLIERRLVTFARFDWGGRLCDQALRLVRDRETGRAVIAAVCTPSAREQLLWAWETLHEYASGPVPGDDHWWREGPLGVLREGVWFDGWLQAL